VVYGEAWTAKRVLKRATSGVTAAPKAITPNTITYANNGRPYRLSSPSRIDSPVDGLELVETRPFLFGPRPAYLSAINGGAACA
jgi:hypothetical protein